jgi:methylthioribose-1-phosphate isomerase
MKASLPFGRLLFFITPPKLVGAVVTEKGVFSPYDLKQFCADGQSK